MRRRIALAAFGLSFIGGLLLQRTLMARHGSADEQGTQNLASVQPALMSQTDPERSVPAEKSSQGKISTAALFSGDDESEAGFGAPEPVPELMGSRELGARLEELLANTDRGADEARRAVLRRWVKLAPREAAAWAQQTTASGIWKEAIEVVAAGWAETDLSGALAWAQTLPESGGKAAALLQVGYEAAREQPTTALAAAAKLPLGEQRNRLLVHAVSQWASKDGTAALDWATGVSDPLLRERLISEAVIALSVRDGSAAATAAAQELQPGREQDRAAAGIVQRWAQTSPGEAARWVQHFPETPARREALQDLIACWVSQDRAGAQNWLFTLPAGSFRDEASAIYARAGALAISPAP
jgi:hypothetical protein